MSKTLYAGAATWVNNLYLEISKGVVHKHSSLNKFGRNPVINTGTDPEDVWDGGGIWVAPTAARIHNIVSTDAVDTSAGTGAQTVLVSGLDSTGVLQSETISMNGDVAPVPTVNSYTMIYRMIVATAGSGGVNAGTITATAVSDATVTAQIAIGSGQTLMAIYKVPLATTLYLTNWYTSYNTSGGATSSADFQLIVTPNGGATNVKNHLGLSNVGDSYFNHVFGCPLVVAALSTVVVRAIEVSRDGSDVSAGFDGVLVQDD